MYIDDLDKITKENILSRELLDEVFDIEDEFKKAEVLLLLESIADDFNKKTEFTKLLRAYVKQKKNEVAKKRDNAMFGSNGLTSFTDSDYQDFKCGIWLANDNGVRTFTMMGEKEACSHPIMPVQLLINAETGFCKVKLAFKLKGKWKDVVVDKEIISSSSKIVSLSKHGIRVTSENAKTLVQYLSDMEALNEYDIMEQISTSKLGWINGEFMPYGSNVIFDNECGLKNTFDAITHDGSREEWYKLVSDIRKDGKMESKIYLVSSFASVMLEFVNALPFIVNLYGTTGKGKAQPLNTKIITPDGYKLMGDISVGDRVIGGDGKPHCVTGVFPQGEIDVYEVLFNDGTSTRCCDEHLWNIRTRKMKSTNKNYKTVSLSEIRKMPIKTGKTNNILIPLCGKVEFEKKQELPISPYMIGLLIGDGCITLRKNNASNQINIFFNNTENDVLDRLRKELELIGSTLVYKNGTQYTIRNNKYLVEKIKDIGLNVLSGEKFIPEIYKRASVSDRMDLLKGLFDTDGNVSGNGSFSYSTSSKVLASDLCDLCRSLGYRTTIGQRDRVGKKYITNGKKYERKSIEYVVRILTNDQVFKSEKHISKVRYKKASHKKNDMAIIDIKYVGKDYCQCIMVDSDEHTYLCDDYIVTHNTLSLMLAASVWADPTEGKFMTDAKSTATASEIRLNFLNNLPLLIDDMAQIKNQYDNDFSKLIYAWCSGVGKGRGTQSLGLTSSMTWKNIIITNAERSLVNESSQGGAINRVIDVEMQCDQIYENGNKIVELLRANYGYAGREFVELLQSMNKEQIQEIQKGYYNRIVNRCKNLGTEKEEKQMLPMSVLLATDYLIEKHLFRDGCLLDFEKCVDLLKSKNEVSENERAYNYLLDEIQMNNSKFASKEDVKTLMECWGIIDTDKALVIINGNAFDNIMKKGNYDPRSFLSWLAKNDKIEIDSDGNKKKNKRINGINGRCVFLKLSGYIDIDEDGFIKIDESQEKLPFE